MNITLFFQDLIKRGAKLWIEEEQLRCQGPGEVLTPEVLAILKQHKNKFLDLLRENIPELGEYPLSHGQQALWFINQGAKESAAYNTAASLRICSPLDVAAMERAFQYLVDRHPLLRGCFPIQDGMPLQRIRENHNVSFEIVDAADFSKEYLKQQVIQAYQQPFNLETDSLLRIHLFRQAEEDYVLLITVHHIVFDAWSGWLFMDEFSKAYSSITADQIPNLPPLQHNYRDYVQGQTYMLAGSEGEKLWQYWQKKLAGDIPVLQLPPDRPRPPVQTFHGATIDFSIDETLTQELRELARIEGTTLFTILMAAFHVLLHRYTGQDDILVGSPTVGRDNRDFTGIAGYFVNPVVIRTDCTGNPTFRSFLRQVSDTVLEAIGHQDFPFPLLVERLQPKRSSGFSPLFQVDFVLQKAQIGDFTNLLDVMGKTEVTMNWGGLKVKPFVIPQQEGQFDVTLEIIELESSLSGHLKYNTDLFDADTIKRMAGHFDVLVRDIVRNPAQRITMLPLLPQEEQLQLKDWNQTETDYPKDKTIVDLFQEQVEKTPDNIAVAFEDQQLTYRELNRKANQLAHYLLNLKTDTDNYPLVTGNCLVGICVERSLEMVIGLLGILKAGCAYVPLDPEYPEHRLQFMLEDSQFSVLLSQSNLLDRLPVVGASLSGCPRPKVVYLDSEWETISKYEIRNPVRRSSSDQLAYVIYTSGSTGKPKGVMVEYGALTNFLLSMQQRVGLTQDDKLLAITTLSFDIAALELYLPVITGAQTILISRDTSSDAKALSQKLTETQTTIMQATPATWKLLIESGWKQSTTLKILCGGESLPVRVGQALLQNCQQLWNVYGPTETTIWSSVHNVSNHSKKPELIGQPIANTKIYILDIYHNITPIGVPGELCIAGVGLARGYLNRPDLTAEKFIEIEIFGKHQHIYKTGDLARWLPDGKLEYLDRIDHQIKLRGFRIELGEIEATLHQHDAVSDAVVVIYETDDNKRLVAYVILKHVDSDHAKLTNELRTWLKTRLPGYMIPSSFTILDKLPLTPNGKVDRKNLQESDIGYRGPEESYIAPRTPEEELLSVIWASVLGVERVSLYDNFFDLGGHSLIATQLVSRIRESFDVEMPLRTVFERDVLKDQAEWLDHQQHPVELPPIVPLAEGDPQVLSFAQQRLWFLAQLEGQSATNNMPATLHLKGELDYAALERSMDTLIKRHDCLRLCFPEVDGHATVKVLDIYNPLIFTDLSDLSGDEQPLQKEELIKSHAQAPFDITTGPLLRLHLVKISDEEHILLFNMHHIISDGWSIGVLIREWSALFSAYYCSQEAELPELSIQYTDYAAWQRGWLSGEVLDKQLDYWQEELSGAPELLELPTDFPRSAVMGYRGSHLQSTIPEELTRSLKCLSREQGVTLYMTMLTAFNVLLYRYSGQEDILVGSPIANRTHRQTEDIIGFFVNTLVLRTRIQPGHSITELLKQVRQTALEAYAHQDIPFEYLVEQLNPTRSLSHSPLFQVMFVLQNAPMGDLEFTGLKVSLLEQESIIAKFDLTLNVAEQDGTLICDWEYCTDLFRSETIERMTEHFQILLDGIINNPSQSVSQLPLLTELEIQQLQAWNQTETDYPKDKTIVDLFQEQVEKTPDNIAVVFEDQQLTYCELNWKANQLAHYLLSLKAGKDNDPLITGNCLVGICVERSLEMVIGLLGILKAGCAYVPLDPNYPGERLAYMIKDSGIRILITQTGIQSKLLSIVPNSCVPSYGAGNNELIMVNIETVLTSHSPIVNLQSSIINPQDLAYVIYTSGSTGKPKGVMVEHAAIAQHIYYSIIRYQIETSDNILQFASLNFDASLEQTFSALCSGGRLVLLRTSILHSQTIKALLEKEHITIANFPPVYWQQLLSEGKTQNYEQLKLLILGGEVLSSQLAHQTRQTLSGKTTFLNAYGPTETTITSTLFEVTEQFQELSINNCTPIGQPLTNKHVYIIDADHNLTPLGIPGELCIAGVGLARGYLNRTDQTAEKFMQIEIFGKRQLIYKTGDRARWLSDGNLEYLGRLDHQVKLRGFRIELGEIESTLNQHEYIEEAVVVLHDNDDDKCLAAYITTINNEEFFHSSLVIELRTWLKTRLPDYMVPAGFMVLDKLPLTPNGKIDRNKLQESDIGYRGPEESYIAPRTPEEELLSVIWANVLKVERVGIRDNFFDLGGHSLIATQLVSRIRDSFGVEMPLRIIFEHSIFQDLSEWLNTMQRKSELPPIVPLAEGDPLVLSFAQQRLWFLAQLEGQSATNNMPATLHLKGELDHAALERSMDTLIKRHNSLRLCFPEVDGHATVKVLDIYNPLIFTDLNGLSDSERQRQKQVLIEDYAQIFFDITTGQLLRLHLLKLSDEEHILLFNMHHIISDGWSIGVLIREWSELYSAYHGVREAELPELSIQYTDYAAWQRNWLSGEVLEQQLNYWREKLSDAHELSELPTDYPRPAVMSYRGVHLRSTIPVELTERLKRLSREQGVTLYMTMLTVFNVLLYRYSGQEDILVGSPIANRTHRQTEDIIGFFVNTLVLRTRIQPGHSITELLKQVRQTALEAYAHQDIPFEYLVEQLNPTRSLSHSPLFQVMFVLQNAPMGELEFTDLKVSLLEQESIIAKFDLTLNVAEQDGTLICDWEYCTDLFRSETIERMTEHFQILLEGIINNPMQFVSQLPLLTETETQQLQEWNQTETDYPDDKTIVDLFHEQVEKTPDNIAVVIEDRQLTYRELNRKANQLAHYLLSLNSETDNSLVGICVERSLEMVIGILGILKAGSAYVPLDPEYPKHRLQFMLEDSQVVVLLTQNNLRDKLPAHQAHQVYLDSNWETIAMYGSDNPSRQSGFERFVYVIYTSGSTGQPKGTGVYHQGFTNLVNWFVNEYQLLVDDNVFIISSFSFDLTQKNIFAPLINGSKLHLLDSVHYDPDKITKNVAEQTITWLNCTPSAFYPLLEPNDENTFLKLSSLRYLFLGGEPIVLPMLQSWLNATVTQTKIVNSYGPTECTDVTTAYLLEQPDAVLDQMIPIGKPIFNIKHFILGQNFEVLPVGVAGELCIAGAGLARGYLNRPDLTAEKFVEVELFGKSERLYKTGDIARWLPDGNLEYLGRLDNQIKLRGFRIELGEIEAMLGHHEAVKEAVVVLQNKEENPILVAYITNINIEESSHSSLVIELRNWLKNSLPEYMVPSSFTVLDTMPLTTNGKIDRKALPSPDTFLIGEHHLAPRNTVELQLLLIWEDVLQVRPISINDNFFELGGHSLLAVRLMSQIEQQLKKHLPLATLFQNSTIEQLATILHQRSEALPWSPLVAIQSNGKNTPLFCVHPAGGNVLCYFELAQHLGKEQSFYGLQAFGMEAEQVPYTHVNDIAEYYLETMQTLQPQGPYQIAGWSFGGLVAFEIARKLQSKGEYVSLLALLDTAVLSSMKENQEPEDDAQFMVNLFKEVEIFLSLEYLRQLTSEEQLAYVLEQGKQVGFFSPDIDLTKAKLLLHVFKTNANLAECYKPHSYRGKIILFQSTERAEDISLKPGLGWEDYATEGVEIIQVPGNHQNMIKSPHVQILAEKLKSYLK
jgi:amino acid adenylation domain-containing protein